MDRWSGQIKEVRNPAKFSTGEVFATWIWPLHTAEALGATGRFLWFLAGLSLFVLYVSGLLRWLCRSGKVHNREMNFAAVRPLLYRMKEMICRASLGLFLLIRLLVQKTKQSAPYIMIGYGVILRWINRIRLCVSNRQNG